MSTFMYPVRLQIVDDSKSFTVEPVGEAKAQLTQLWVMCFQPDETHKTFDILAGESPTCVPGLQNVKFPEGYIVATNMGSVTGTLFIRVYDDTGTELYYGELDGVAPGESISNTGFYTDMPDRPYTITVEVGHK